MTRLLIGNDFNENLRDDRTWVDWWVQRLAWFAKDGDVLVLPVEPDLEFFAYATGLTGTDSSSLRFVVPPKGYLGSGTLTSDRLADPEFRQSLRQTLAGCDVREVFALWPDASVARLASWLGVERALPGAGFLGQGGGAMVNSKVAFRAIAGGVDVSLPAGGVAAGPVEAEEIIMEVLEVADAVMLKRDFSSGGHGNEIISMVAGLRPVGARRVVTVSDRGDVRAYLEDSWHWLSQNGRNQVVIEEYFRDSTAVFAEFELTDAGIVFAGQGEMMSAPFGVAEMMPVQGIEPATVAEIIDGGRRLCQPLHAMGYRGTLSADAIVTPRREVYFSEYNGRITGSTHIYASVGARVVGPDCAQERILMDRIWPSDWSTTSFRDALDRISEAGLAYDPTTRTGVVVCSAYDKQYHSVMHCVVAENLDMLWNLHQRLTPLFTRELA